MGAFDRMADDSLPSKRGRLSLSGGWGGGFSDGWLGKVRMEGAVRAVSWAASGFLLAAGCFAALPGEDSLAYARRTEADSGKAVCLLRQDALQAFYGVGKAKRSVEEDDCLGPDASVLAASGRDASGFEIELRDMLADAPMSAMAPAIAKQDRTVAAFLVGIAKKESDWGRRSPSLEGEDCYNYWGYKGPGSRGAALGYGCFATPEEAVEAVGGRIAHFVHGTRRTTPADMVVWKCGSSCAGHSPESVRKWIADVSVYYEKVAD
jgi:hypothetical protein